MALPRLVSSSSSGACAQVRRRLESLDAICLAELQSGLEAMAAGDLTREVVPGTSRLDITVADPEMQGVVDAFNSMLERAQGAIRLFNEVREALRAALGDRSCLVPLTERLASLDEHCLSDLESGLAAAAAGDLRVCATPVTTPLSAPPGADLGLLGELFNGMLGKAQASVVGYEAMRRQTAQMVGDIAATAEALSASAEQMSGIADDTGRAVEEISTTVDAVATGSGEQARSAQEVSDQVTVATGVVRHLGERSEAIGQIVETIGGIAAQTNLLALNAAIEAARAGDQGRGFAVVADEVRTLAESSRQSVTSISAIIHEIQGETQRAVSAMAGVEAGVAGVATVSEQNASAAEEVSAATQQTAASAQRVADAAERVSSAALTLGGLVGRFSV